MRTKLKKLTSVCLAVIMMLSVLTVAPFTAGAAEENSESVSEISGDFEYIVLDDGTASIIGYSGSETNLTIPSEIDGYTVTEVGYEAFYGNTSLTSVTIPDTVTRIGSNAFRNCENLTSVTIPDSVTSIGVGAFTNTALSDITIPASVKYIYEITFGYVFNEDSWEYEKVDGFTISGYTNSAADVYARENGFKFVSLGEVSPFGYDVLSDGTAEITEYRGNEANLTIPSEIDGYTVTEIDSYAFYGKTNLTSVTIPDSVTYIGGFAFADCKNLKSVTIHAIVQDIGSHAFGYNYDEDIWEYVKADNFTISGYTGSEAEIYAVCCDITFISLGDAPAPALGDVNGDGSISIDDVTEIQKYLANMLDFTTEQEELADVDKNGGISIDDVTLIQKSLAGLAVIE